MFCASEEADAYLGMCEFGRVWVGVCAWRSLSPLHESKRAGRPPHFLNSDNALILIPTVARAFTAKRGCSGGARWIRSIHRTPRGHNSRLLVLWRNILWRDGGRQKTEAQSDSDSSDPCCVAEVLCSSPDHTRRRMFISSGFTWALLIDSTHKHQCKSCFYTSHVNFKSSVSSL